MSQPKQICLEWSRFDACYHLASNPLQHWQCNYLDSLTINSTINSMIKTNKSISVAWSRIAVDHLALNPHQQWHYNHLDSRQQSWSKQMCSPLMVARHVCDCPEKCVQPTLMRIICAQVMSTSFVCNLCTSIECKFCLQVRPVWFPCEVCADSGTSRRRDPRGNATQEVEPILRSHNEYTMTRTMCANVYIVYFLCRTNVPSNNEPEWQ